jgi:hypothetical protein
VLFCDYPASYLTQQNCEMSKTYTFFNYSIVFMTPLLHEEASFSNIESFRNNDEMAILYDNVQNTLLSFTLDELR